MRSGRWALCAALLALLCGCDQAAPARPGEPIGAPPRHRVVGIGYEDVTRADQSWDDVSARLRDVGATGVTLAVGRPEWVLFPWPGRQDTWGPGVTADHDPVQRVISTLRDGGRRSIALTIDVLAPRTIELDPSRGTVSAAGVPSKTVLSGAALLGAQGDRIAAMCGEVARRYRPDGGIVLSELFFEGSYGTEDLASYRATTGQDDWPRTWRGSIDTGSELLDRWRVEVIDSVVRRCAAAAHAHGVRVDVDVRADRRAVDDTDDTDGADDTDDTHRLGRPDSGQDYAALLGLADRITVWNYFGLDRVPPQDSEVLTAALARRLSPADLARVTVSVGLWSLNEDGYPADLDPARLREGLARSASHGIGTVHVTPMSKFTPEHWRAIAAAWRPAPATSPTSPTSPMSAPTSGHSADGSPTP